MPQDTISFDRAAGFYDETRGFPEGVAPQAAALIAEAGGLRPGSRVLEVGIGTGRVALPLLAHLDSITGIDISTAMMRRLLAKREPDQHVHLAQANALHLPFVDSAFDALVVVHVFHLLPDSDQIKRELRRILKPDGVVLHCWNTNDSTLKEARSRAGEAMGIKQQGQPSRWHHVQTFLDSAGWAREREPAFDYTTEQTPQELIDAIQNRIWSSTWDVDDDKLNRGIEAMRQHLVAEYGDDLEVPVEITNTFTVTVYRRP